MTRDEARELIEKPISEEELESMERSAASGSDPEPQAGDRGLVSGLWLDIYRLVKEVKRLRALTAILVLLAAPLYASAQVRIAASDQVPNREPGYCLWASMETACVHAGCGEARGLVDWYAGQPYAGGTLELAERQLRALGVRYRLVRTAAELEAATGAGCPVIALVPHHAVTVIRADADYVWFLDSDRPERTLVSDHASFPWHLGIVVEGK